MNKNILRFLCVLTAGIVTSLPLYAQRQLPGSTIRLVGVGNYFEALRVAQMDMPTVHVVHRAIDKNKPGRVTRTLINQSYRGGLQVVDLPLPLEIEVKYSKYNNGQPYTIVIERETDTHKRLACQGTSMVTVKAHLKGSTAYEQKICIPLSSTSLPAASSVIQSGDFNNVAFFVGPLSAHEAALYDPQDVRSLPFTFGLMGWTSTIAPWNNKTIGSFSWTTDQTKATKSVTFGKPLEVLQGFAALGGGGEIPRKNHFSIAHVFNDSPHIIILSRESTNRVLAPLNITQVVPPYSVMPYIMAWAPGVEDSEELMQPGHDGIRIAALQRPAGSEGVRAPSVIRHSEIQDLGPDNNAELPQSLKELERLIASSLSTLVSDKAADLLGVTLWNKEMQSAYKNFDAADHYYSITADRSTKKVYVQKFSVKDNSLMSETVPLSGVESHDARGVPNYGNLVISQDPKSGDLFNVQLYPMVLRSPRRR